MFEITFYENVLDENYTKLIDYFSKNSDCISLQIRSYVEKTFIKTKKEIIELGKSYERELDHFKVTDDWINSIIEDQCKLQESINKIESNLKLLSKHLKSKYYSYEYVGSIYKNKSAIYLFNIADEVVGYLKKANSLFDWYDDRPEDICFYRNGRCLMSSIAHENQYSIYIDDLSEINKLKLIGNDFTIRELSEYPSIKLESD